jgi:hypothetical protein
MFLMGFFSCVSCSLCIIIFFHALVFHYSHVLLLLCFVIHVLHYSCMLFLPHALVFHYSTRSFYLIAPMLWCSCALMFVCALPWHGVSLLLWFIVLMCFDMTKCFTTLVFCCSCVLRCDMVFCYSYVLLCSLALHETKYQVFFVPCCFATPLCFATRLLKLILAPLFFFSSFRTCNKGLGVLDLWGYKSRGSLEATSSKLMEVISFSSFSISFFQKTFIGFSFQIPF